jgi:hypothetical protein
MKQPAAAPADPELTRTSDPELTRCEHCGVLDHGTRPLMQFKGQHKGDGWTWLHPECESTFEPVISWPLGKIPFLYSEPWWIKNPPAHQPPPLSNIRARARAANQWQSDVRVVCVGGVRWCACEPDLEVRHKFRFEYFIEVTSNGEWKRMPSTKPPFEKVCAYCRKAGGVILRVAIGTPTAPGRNGEPGRSEVEEVWLHQKCEAPYLRLIGQNPLAGG